MMSDLREEWIKLTPEERYPFEIISSEDEREYKRRMKEVDPKWVVTFWWSIALMRILEESIDVFYE